MASFRRTPYIVNLVIAGAAILIALVARIAPAGQARVAAETAGATRLSPAELEKKYEEATQFLNMTPVVSSTPYVEGHAHPNGDALKEPDLYYKKILQAMERA